MILEAKRKGNNDAAMQLLAEIGIPFSEDGTPLGIGRDDD